MGHIVVGIDGGAPSKTAALRAVELAIKLEHKVHFVTVERRRDVEHVESGTDRWIIDNVEAAREHVQDFLAESEVKVDHSVSAVTGTPAKALVDEATRLGAQMIVVGNADMQRVTKLLGTVAAGVAGKAPCDVLIVKTN